MNAITTPFADCLTNVPNKTTVLLPTAAMAVVVATTTYFLAGLLLVTKLGMEDLASGISLGVTIQTAAGVFSISEGAEDTIALMQLISVSILAPVLAIAAVLISVTRAEVMSQSSRCLVRMGVFAVGIKTDLKRVLAVEKPTNALLITETIFIAGLILLGINYIS